MSAPVSSGSGQTGRLEQLIGHTKDVENATGDGTFGQCALNTEGWGVDYTNNKAAQLGLVVVDNSDGSRICVSKVAF